MLTAPFPAAPILRARFLDFRVNFRIIGRRGFVLGNQGYPVCSMAAAEKGASKIRPRRKSSVSPYSWRAGEHSYEVVLVVRSVAVRRHTRFRVEGGYFPAAAIVGTRFLEFSQPFRTIGALGFDAGNQGASFLHFLLNSRIIGRKEFDAKSQGSSFPLWRHPKSTRPIYAVSEI